MASPIEHPTEGAYFFYGGIEFTVTSLTSTTFEERCARIPTGSLANWLALSQAVGQKATFISGDMRYEVIIRSVEPQYDSEAKYEGEVAVVIFEFILKKRAN